MDEGRLGWLEGSGVTVVSGPDWERRREAVDEILVEALGNGASYARAAKIAKTSSKTVYRKMRDDRTFRRRVEERTQEHVREVVGGLGALAHDAIEVLRTRMFDGSNPAEQLRAAGLVFSQLVKFRQVAEFENRLREVEVQVGLRAERAVEGETSESAS
jgi:hypothetical protein